jgi:hypothetical protein
VPSIASQSSLKAGFLCSDPILDTNYFTNPWSEDGFNHLLLLRIAWANDRFDDLFPSVPNARTDPSPNL